MENSSRSLLRCWQTALQRPRRVDFGSPTILPMPGPVQRPAEETKNQQASNDDTTKIQIRTSTKSPRSILHDRDSGLCINSVAYLSDSPPTGRKYIRTPPLVSRVPEEEDKSVCGTVTRRTRSNHLLPLTLPKINRSPGLVRSFPIAISHCSI